MSIELHPRGGVLVGRVRVPGGLLGGARLLRQPHDGQEAHPQSGEENTLHYRSQISIAAGNPRPVHGCFNLAWETSKNDVSAVDEGVFAKVRPKGARLN